MVYSRVVDPTAEVHGKREGRALHTSPTPERHFDVPSDGAFICDARISSPPSAPVSNTFTLELISTATAFLVVHVKRNPQLHGQFATRHRAQQSVLPARRRAFHVEP